MALSSSKAYTVVIGGGFYGVNIALHLAEKDRGQVILLEKENSLLSRASYHNQARVHNGYHYPRSFTTAYRSHINLQRFVNDWPSAVKKDFTKLYAIARNNSKVTAKQFVRFCKEIGVKLEPSEDFSHLFNNRLIEQSFLVDEYDEVYIAYNEFRSVIAQNRKIEKLLPIDPRNLEGDETFGSIDYIYEPDSSDILDQLLPLHLNTQLWKAVLESNASEQGARMSAMDSATENAKELERELRLKYNQARQSAITTEISEIVSGAQALSDS